jgi:hypothetical protein
MGLVAQPDLPWRKVFGVAAVIILHVAIVAVLLDGTMVRRIFRPAPRETILYLQPLPKPQTKPEVAPRIMREAPPARRIAPLVKLQDDRGVTQPQTNDEASKPDTRPAYQLYDCRAANLPRLTPEQRAACAKSAVGPKQNDNSVDYADHSDSIPGSARWAREKARKNSPALLPCMSSQGLSVPNPLCLANGVINGFDPDNQASYGDKPDDTHVPNNGDPPPMYKDPDH